MAPEPKKFMVSRPKIYATFTFKQYALFTHSPPPPQPPPTPQHCPAGLEKVYLPGSEIFYFTPARTAETTNIHKFIYSF